MKRSNYEARFSTKPAKDSELQALFYRKSGVGVVVWHSERGALNMWLLAWYHTPESCYLTLLDLSLRGGLQMDTV